MFHIRSRNRIGCHSDPRSFAAIFSLLFEISRRSHIGQEDVLPLDLLTGVHISDVENCVRKLFVEYPRSIVRRQLGRRELLRDCVSREGKSAIARATQSPSTQTPARKQQNGLYDAALGTPEARIAIISLSADILLSPIRMPTSTPNGSENGTVAGSAKSSSFVTSRGGAELRTSSAKSRSIVWRNRTNVKSNPPRRHWSRSRGISLC